MDTTIEKATPASTGTTSKTTSCNSNPNSSIIFEQEKIITNEKRDFRIIRAESITILEGKSNLTQHPLSAAFPKMPDDEFESLKGSIKAIGIQHPIVIFEDMVLDGWHRYCAGKACFMRIPTVQLGDVDPIDFVIAANEKRRHLTPSQITAAVVAVHAWYPSGANRLASTTVQPGCTVSKTNAELANIAGVSTEMIRQAKVVQQHASPEVKAAVKSGKISLKSAAATTMRQKRNTPSSSKKTQKAAPDCVDDEPKLDPNQQEIAELREIVRELTKENDALKDRLAIGLMTGTEEEKASALVTITDLRKTISKLEIELDSFRGRAI